MKNSLIILLLTILLSTAAFGNNYIVYGAGDPLANGIYFEQGINEGHPYYKNGTYILAYTEFIGCMYKWVILKDSIDMIYKNYNISYAPPYNDWQITCNMYSVSPAPVVFPEGPALLYSQQYFAYNESSLNDGSIDNSNSLFISLTNYNNEVFTGNNGDDFFASNKVQFQNVPSGLIPFLEKINDTLLQLSFIGNALLNNPINNVMNISFVFMNTAYSGNDTSLVFRGLLLIKSLLFK